MRKSYELLCRFDKRQFFKAFSLLALSFFLSLIPLLYALLDDMYTSAENYKGFFSWAICNSEIYFLLLSTVFTSFIEYIMTIKNTANGLIFFNAAYVILLSAVWAVIELRTDLIEKIMNDFDLKIFLIVLMFCAVGFCLINLFFMNFRESTDNKDIYIRKKII